MKRLHVHLSVDDLARSVRFYSTLFAAEPTVLKQDYAKWMLEDPRVNFAISARGGEAGVDHLGIQVENREELAEVYGRLKSADRPVLEQGDTTCCYATSEKSWIADPSGLAWEAFLTHGDSTVYGESADLTPTKAAATACCKPSAEEIAATPKAAGTAGGCGCAA
jgi:catechol 2,3-dioxygenase-like lactoylglutathione lyase family enzyme